MSQKEVCPEHSVPLKLNSEVGPATLPSSAKSLLVDTGVTSDLSPLTVDVCQHLRTAQGDPHHTVPPGVQTRVPWVGDKTWPPQ